jgi:hypothetical protein
LMLEFMENNFFIDGQHIDLDKCFRFINESIELVRHKAKPSLNEGMSQ